MATLTVPYSFNPNTAIVASEMNTNFGAIKTFVEALAAGTNIDSAAITTDKLATNTIQLLTPTGSVTQYAGSSAPTGWMFCDGAAVSRTTYAALFAVIGTTFGSGDGTTTFNLPDLKGRVPVGKAVAGTFASLAATGGAETHTLTTAQIPSHQHNVTAYSHTVTQSNALGNHSHGAGTYASSGSVTGGGDHSHTGTVDSGGFHDHSVPTRNTTSTSHTHQSGTRISVGASAANETDTTRTVDYGGTHTHTFTSASAAHSHGFSGGAVSGTSGDTDLAHGHGVGVNAHDAKLTEASGGGGAHNNLQPYLVINYIIKL